MDKRSRQQPASHAAGKGLIHPTGVQIKANRRVAICVPVSQQVPFEFAYDLAQMVGYTAARLNQNKIESCAVIVDEGTLIAPQRNRLLDLAVGGGFTHALFIDSDMRFPKNGLEYLAGLGLDVVGANYSRRVQPLHFSAYKTVDPENKAHELLVTTVDDEHLEEVDGMGCGFMMIDLNIVKRIPRPWFHIPYNEERDDFQAEDITFCLAAKKAGFQVFVDHGLSQMVRHMGTMEYTTIHALDAIEHMRRAEEGTNDATGGDHDGDGTEDRTLQLVKS